MTLASTPIPFTPAPHGPTAVDSEGWLYDTETGEVLGLASPTVDTIDSPESTDAVLEIRARIEGRIVALRARRAALLRHLDALEAIEARRLAWWDWRYRDLLVEFARRSFEGAKTRTLKLAFGTVAFRATRGTNKIISMDQAVEWVRRRDPELVKTVETVTVGAVLSLSDGRDLPWLESTGPGETITVDTGVLSGAAKGGAS